MLGRYLRIPLLLVQILQYVLCILNKRNNKILRQIISFEEKSKNTTKTKQKVKHKNSCQIWESNLGPLAPSRMHSHWTTESTASIDCCQAILLFQRNRSKRKQTKPKLWATSF